MMKRWQCTVCGYIHEGDEPPEFCPVCGADRSKFTPMHAEKSNLWQEMAAAFRLHPILAHFPGGLIPTAVLFLLLFPATGNSGLESAAYWLILVTTAVIPFSVGTGMHDWHKYFGEQRMPIYFKKAGLALCLLLLALTAISLRYGQPELLASGGWQRWLYVVCLLGMLACVALLGHFGSLLATQSARLRENSAK